MSLFWNASESQNCVSSLLIDSQREVILNMKFQINQCLALRSSYLRFMEKSGHTTGTRALNCH